MDGAFPRFSGRGSRFEASPHRRRHRSIKLQQRNRRLFLESLECRSLLAQMTWDGGGGDGNWLTSANWVGDIAPRAGDDLVFQGAVNLSTNNNFAAGTEFNTITIRDPGFTLAGAAISLRGGLTDNATGATNTVSLDITLLNSLYVVSANPGHDLNISGTIATGTILGSSGLSFGTSALNFDGSGNIVATGIISGSGSLSKHGDGMLILGGQNTYEGHTDVRQGILRVTDSFGLGSALTGHTDVQQGAQLQVDGTDGALTIAEQLAIREGGVGFGSAIDPSSLGALRNIAGDNKWSGGVGLAGIAANTANLIGVSGGTLDISGVISQPTSAPTTARLIKVGTGALTLSGTSSNVYTGDTVVLQGELRLNKTAGQDAIGGNLIIGDNVDPTSTGATPRALVTVVTSHQIPKLNFYDVALTTVTLNSSGRLNLGGALVSEEIGNLALVTGTVDSADVDLNGGTLTLGGATIGVTAANGSSGVSPAATIQDGTFNLGTLFSGAGGGLTKTITVADTQLTNIAADLNISANIVGASGVSLTKAGAGTLQISGNNSSMASPVIWTAGLINVSSASNMPFGSTLLSIQGATDVLQAVGGAVTISTPVSLDANFATIGANSIEFTGPATLTGTRTIQVMDPAQTLKFSGAISEGIFGSQSITKGGRGTLALTGANTFSGTITINNDGGRLLLGGAAGSIRNVSALTVGVGGILDIDNSGAVNNNRVSDAATIALNGKLLFTGNAGAPASEYVSTITPGGSLASTIEIKNLGDTAAFTANGLVTGTDRTVNFIGTNVALSDSTAPGASRISFTNNPAGLDDGILPMGMVTGPSGEIDFATYGSSPEGIAIIPLPASAYVTDLSQASAASNVRVSANTVLTTSKNVNAILVEPGVNITGTNATLSIAAGRTIFAGTGSIAVTNLNTGTGMLSVVDGATATISSSIFAGNIQKAGRGTLVLSGDNQTAGTFNLNEGILELAHSNALGAPSTTTTRQGTTLQVTGNINIGLETLALNGVGFSPNAPGSGSDTYASATGALRALGGASTWAGNVTRGGDATDLTGLLGGFPIIASAVASMSVGGASDSLTLTGTLGSDNVELLKIGAGTLELAGVNATSSNQNTRIYQGTLELDREDGINGIDRGTIFIGSDGPGAPAATLRLASSDMLGDGVAIQVHSSGTFDLDGNSDVMAALNLVVAAGGAADVDIDGVANTGNGTLTTNGNITVFTQGVGHGAGATIDGGTLALDLFGSINTPSVRTWQVNDGAAGDDLVVTSSVVDGTGLRSMGITKTGLGSLQLGGTTANSLTGTTSVNEGTLVLNKTGGNAINGPLVIGQVTSVDSGFGASDIVRLGQPNQLPDFLAAITINNAGLLDLAGNNETIGQADAQTALTITSGTVDTGGATLTVNGNIVAASSAGAGLWTPQKAAQILGGTLALGGVVRTIDVGTDTGSIPFELQITSNITGSGGITKINTGALMLSGNNSGLTGAFHLAAGHLALSNQFILGVPQPVLGTGQLFILGSASIVGHGDVLTIGNEVFASATTLTFGTGGTIGGGGNDVRFAAPVTAYGAVTLAVPTASTVELAQGLGESAASVALTKTGFGAVTLSGNSPYSGTTSLAGPNAGTLILKGPAKNTASFAVGVGSTLQIDDSGVQSADKLGDATVITLSGGQLALVGNDGAISSETLGQITLGNDTSSEIHSLVSPVAGSAANWRIARIAQNAANNGAMFNLIGRGVAISDNSANKVNLTTLTAAEGLDDGIIRFGVMTTDLDGTLGDDFDFIGQGPLNADATNHYLEAFSSASLLGANFATNFVTRVLGGAVDGSSNVKLAASAANGAAAVNALLMNGAAAIATSGASLTANSGLVASSGGAHSIDLGPNTLTLGGGGIVDGLAFVDRGSSLSIPSIIGGATNQLSKDGAGTLTLDGPGINTYGAITRVNQGIYQAQKATAFGGTGGGVNVAYGATVELSGGVSIPAETITLNGSGEGTTGNIPLRNTGGTNTWAGQITLGGNRTGIDVVTGSELIVTGILATNAFNKYGGGTLETGGGAPNTLAAASIIWQGTVELNKTTGNALNFATGNPTIFVGDHIGGDNADRLVQIGSDQIVDFSTTANQEVVRVHSSGLYDLNGQTESFGGVTMAVANNTFNLFVGPISSGEIDLNGGTLNLVGGTVAAATNTPNVVVTALAGGTPVAATIADGTVDITNGLLAGATLDFNVGDSAAVEDLVITANLGGTGGFDKITAGRLVLNPSGANVYAGTTSILGGELVVRDPTALGTTAGNTVVGSGLSLLIDDVDSAEPLNLNGIGLGGQGAVRSVAGTNTWTGGVTLAGNTTIGVDDSGVPADRLIIDGVITGVTFTLTKLLPGTLQLAGTTSNTGTGVWFVHEGTMELNKNDGLNAGNNLAAAAVPFRFDIGNNAGGQDADVARWMNDNQFADGVGVANHLLVTETTGFGDFNGFDETIVGPTTLSIFTRYGTTQSGHFDLGGGTLTLGDGVANGGGWGARGDVAGTVFTVVSPAALIENTGGTGTVVLTSNNAAWGDTGTNDALTQVEFEMAATVTNTGTGRILKQGAGTLALTGDNSTTLVGHTINLNSAGFLAIKDGNSLGDAASTINVTAATNLIGVPGGPAVVDGHDITLNGDLFLRGNTDITLNGDITLTASRGITGLINAANTVVLGGTISLSNSAANNTLTITNSIFGGGITSGVLGGDVTITGQIVDGGTSTASALTKAGVGLLTLSPTAANTYGGTTTVSAGSLRVTAGNALGSPAGITTVANAGALQLAGGITVTGETLQLQGTANNPAFSVNGGFASFGHLRNFSGTNVWQGTVNLLGGNTTQNSASTIGVDAGSDLTINGDIRHDPTVTAGTRGLFKVSNGTLEFQGGGANTYAGTTQVLAGLLELNKTAAINAFGGALTIGDDGGGDNAAQVVLLADNQIPAVAVTVASSGQFNLGAFNDAIGALTINRLADVAGDVTTGAGALTLGGTLTLNNSGVTTGATPAATITGNLNAGGARTFTVNDSYALNAAEDDLVISAVITNATPTFNGIGTVVLTGDNTYSGATVVTAAAIDFNSAGFNNGTNAVVGGTLIVRDGGVLGTTATADITVNAGATLTLDNTGGTVDRIANLADLTLAGGTFNLIGAAAGSVEQINLLNINAPSAQTGTDNTISIDSTLSGANVAEFRAASIARGAGGVVHFIGIGADLDNTTNSLIQITGGTSPFVNGVIPYATMSGPAGFDLVTDGDGTATTAPYYIARPTAGNALTGYNASVNSGGIVRVTGGTDTLTANRTIDALLIEGGAKIDLDGFNLIVGTATAGLVYVRGTGNEILNSDPGSGGLDFATREALFLVGSDLDISAALNGSGALRKERSGSLSLSGDSDAAAGQVFSGSITVNAGTLTAANADAFGTTAAGVVVNRRAALILDTTTGNLDFNAEAITINGYGLNDDLDGDSATRGSLRVIGGNTATVGSGATVFTINQATTPNVIDVASSTTLNLLATVTGNNPLTKIGAGTLIYGGNAQNSSTGAISVNEGTLQLNKTAGTGPIAVRGVLTINDLTGNIDPAGSATVTYGTGAIADQIGTVAVNVNSNGTLNSGSTVNDTVGLVTIQGGTLSHTAGAGILTATGLTMTGGEVTSNNVTLAGDVIYSVGLTNAAGNATISGNLNLGGGNRTFTIADGVLLNELTIDGALSSGRLIKAGAGGLRLNNSGNAFLAGVDEVQRVTFTVAPVNGSLFTLNYGGNSTGSTIVYDAVTPANTATNIRLALEALANIEVGDVSVAAVTATTFDVRFTGNLATADVAQMTAATTSGTITTPVPQQTNGVAGIIHNLGILSVGHDTALGTARVQVNGAATQILPVGGDRTLDNSLFLVNAATITFGGRRDFGGTNDLTLTGNIALRSDASQASAQGTNLDVIDPQTLVTFSGEISNGGNLIVPIKRGIGTLVWSGNNTFDVRNFTNASSLTSNDGIRVEGGILRVAHDNALGTIAENASVSIRADFGAVLEIDGTTPNGDVDIQGRVLDIGGTENGTNRGFLNRTSTADVHTGNLRSTGNNSIVSPNNEFRLRHTGGTVSGNPITVYIGVDSGRLDMNGAFTGLQNDAVPTAATNKSIFKTGGGTLRYSGATANTIVGTTAVMNGDLELNKSAGLAISGALQIGDNVGSDDSAEVVYVSGAAADQIGGVAVTIGIDGELDLNSYGALTDTVGAVILTVGETISGDINTGASTSNLDFSGLTVTPRPGLNTAVSSVISGGLALAGVRTFAVGDSPNAVDLQVSALVSGAGGITHNLAGQFAARTELTAANTYAGTTIVTTGALRLSGAGRPGSASVAGNTAVGAGAALELNGVGILTEPISLNGIGILNNSVVVNGTALLGTGALRNVAGDNVLNAATPAALTLAAAAVVNVEASSSVDVGVSAAAGGVVAYSTFALTKSGTGDLELTGTTANSGTGAVNVLDGPLTLSKTGAGANTAVLGTLTIGNNVGADNSATVVLSVANQIANGAAVNILREGRLNAAGFAETVGAIALDVGALFSADIVVGDNTSGATNAFSGGAVTVRGQGGTTSANSVPAAVLSGTVAPNDFYNLGGVTRVITVFDTAATVDFQIDPVIETTGAFGITKEGRGTLQLNGANTYGGATLVGATNDAGALILGGGGSLAAGAVTVSPNSVLGGGNGAIAATIGGPISLAAVASNLPYGGILNPGQADADPAAPNNTGILIASGGVTWGTGSAYFVDLNGIVAGSEYDQLQVTSGAVAITSGALLGTSGPTVTDADKMMIIRKDSVGAISGTFANAPQNGTIAIGNRNYTVTYVDNSGGSLGNGNDLVLNVQDTTKIAVSGVVFDAGLAGTSDDSQRSMVKRVQVNFTGIVDNVLPGAFQVVNVNEMQRITIGLATGTFTLSFDSQSTGALPYNATPAAVQAALNALPTIMGIGSVRVIGSARDYTVLFGGLGFAKVDVSQIVATGSAVPTVTTLSQGGAVINPTVTGQGSPVLTLTFSGPGIVGGSLADGNYELVIDGSKLLVGANSTVDTDGDGDLDAQDNARTDAFFRWFGDFDGDRDVDAADAALFSTALYKPANYKVFYDYDGDGDVDGTDNNEFRRRYLKTLPNPGGF